MIPCPPICSHRAVSSEVFLVNILKKLLYEFRNSEYGISTPRGRRFLQRSIICARGGRGQSLQSVHRQIRSAALTTEGRCDRRPLTLFHEFWSFPTSQPRDEPTRAPCAVVVIKHPSLLVAGGNTISLLALNILTDKFNSS